MIENQTQYEVTKQQIEKLTEALNSSKKGKDKTDLEIYNAVIAGIESQINELEEEVRKYKLKSK